MGKGRGEKNSVEIISALHVPFWRVSVAALSWREPGEPGGREVWTKSGFCYANSNDV
jgi:hypothetical protein